jgi:hypothetical protein
VKGDNGLADETASTRAVLDVDLVPQEITHEYVRAKEQVGEQQIAAPHFANLPCSGQDLDLQRAWPHVQPGAMHALQRDQPRLSRKVRVNDPPAEPLLKANPFVLVQRLTADQNAEGANATGGAGELRIEIGESPQHRRLAVE